MLTVTAVAFLPSLGNGFVDWDDDQLVTDNTYIQTLSPANLATLFFKPLTNAYHPLTFLVWALGYRLWGATPFGYHLLGLVLHLTTAALVFRWVVGLEKSVLAAAVAALLFAVHPMRVESVAWVSDLKDLLAGLFFMATLLAFERSLREGQAKWYPAALGLFLMAVLSKSTAVALPAILVLADFLHRRPQDRRSVLQKLPFFAVAGLFAVVALVSRGRFEAFIGQELAQESYPVSYRLFLVGHRLVYYFLQRTVAPSRGMDSLYPEVVGGSYLSHSLAWGGVLLLLLAGLAVSARFTRKGVFGAGFFLVTLSPALATVSYGYTADRFSYVPAIGLSYLAGVGAVAVVRSVGSRQALRALFLASCGTVLAVLAALTWRQCAVWKDSVSLWSDAIGVYRNQPNSVNRGVALVNRGRAWLMREEYQRALADFNEALPLAPNRHHTLYYRAAAHGALGERDQAVGDLAAALSLAPDYQPAREMFEALTASGPGSLPGGGR